MVTSWIYDNALNYGLSVFLEFEKLPYPSVISISVILNVLPHTNKLYRHGKALMQHVIIT